MTNFVRIAKVVVFQARFHAPPVVLALIHKLPNKERRRLWKRQIQTQMNNVQGSQSRRIQVRKRVNERNQNTRFFVIIERISGSQTKRLKQELSNLNSRNFETNLYPSWQFPQKSESETLFISAPVILVSRVIHTHQRFASQTSMFKDPQFSSPELRFGFSCLTTSWVVAKTRT